MSSESSWTASAPSVPVSAALVSLTRLRLETRLEWRRRGILVGMEGRLFGESEGGAATHDVPASEAPLAVRMRPRSLSELVGQEHLLGDGSALRTAVETREPHSAILYGPP